MDEDVGTVAFDHLGHAPLVAHVELLVLDARSVAARRADVADHDPLGVLALAQALDEPAADVAGTTRDEVAHWLRPLPLLAGQPGS